MSEQWWETEDSDEAREHRAFLAKYATPEVARSAASKPPAPRRARSKQRASASDFELFGKCMRDALAPLQKRLAELEDRKAMSWRGAWRTGIEYAEYDVCQDKGALYICKAPTSDARPGSGPGWQLMAKTTKVEDAK
jgi:hypothetical protein